METFKIKNNKDLLFILLFNVKARELAAKSKRKDIWEEFYCY